MARKEEYSITKKDMLTILGKGFTRRYGAPIFITDFKHRLLSEYPTKSIAFDIYEIVSQTPEKPVPVPGRVVFKAYRPTVEKTSETVATSCRDEYEIEKRMLALSTAGRLQCEIDDVLVRVYPECYSLGVEEADQKMVIVREFITSPPLEEITKGEETSWEPFKKAYQTVAVLHANSPWILNEAGGLPKLTVENMTEGFVVYCSRIAEAARKFVSEQKIERLRRIITEIMKKYLFLPRFEHVINGDLDIYAHHITRGPILDAGGTRIGPLMCDLVFSADPCFEKYGDLITRGKKSIEMYEEAREKVGNILQFENDALGGLSNDFLIVSYLTAALKGSIRRVASILNYKFEYLSDFEKRTPTNLASLFRNFHLMRGGMPRAEFEREVNGFLSSAFNISHILRADGKNFRRLEEILKDILPERIEVRSGDYGNPQLIAKVEEDEEKTEVMKAVERNQQETKI